MGSRLLIIDVRYTDAVANQIQAVLIQLSSQWTIRMVFCLIVCQQVKK
jgi:hypothetical protein